MRFFLIFILALAARAPAAESLLRSGDLVTMVGGEELAASAEAGEMELALTQAAPELQLSFRSLAWEGDTVYEQRRDLNYPKLEDQLSTVGATVVLLDFGQMESLGGAAKLPTFVAAYQKLLDRLAAPGRRFLLFLPHHFTAPPRPGLPDLTEHNDDVDRYAAAIREIAERHHLAVSEWTFSAASAVTALTRDGIHLNPSGEALRAQGLANQLFPDHASALASPRKTPQAEKLLRLIREKNRLWFNYYRPQNWAFLAGDRVNQPSSRDHLDPSKRWFPSEMEQYLPLIGAREREIRDSAQALSHP